MFVRDGIERVGGLASVRQALRWRTSKRRLLFCVKPAQVNLTRVLPQVCLPAVARVMGCNASQHGCSLASEQARKDSSNRGAPASSTMVRDSCKK